MERSTVQGLVGATLGVGGLSWGLVGAASGVVVGVRHLLFAHATQPLDDLGVVVGRGVGLGEFGPEDSAVAVAWVVADGMAQELEVDSDLMRATCKWQTVYDAITFILGGGKWWRWRCSRRSVRQ